MQKGNWKGVYGDIDSIFRAGLARVDPYALLRSSVTVTGDTLTVTADDAVTAYDLSAFDEVLVIGAGKATARMALAVEGVLGPRLSAGLIAVKKGHEEKLARIECIAAGHPVPDTGSLEAGRRIRDLCAAADERTLIVNLLSGGGSALLSLPLQWEGRGQPRLPAARRHPGNDAGPSRQRRHDPGNQHGAKAPQRHQGRQARGGCRPRDAGDPDPLGRGRRLPGIHCLGTHDGRQLDILRCPGGHAQVPPGILSARECPGDPPGRGRGRIPETPKEGDAVFARTRNILLGTNAGALRAAEARPARRGYATSILASGITGEAREIAKVFLAIARDISRGRGPLTAPACILAGGETTVTLCGSHGQGGRNQEMALSFLYELSCLDATLDDVCFFSGATDGNDGPTDAAGAFASSEAIAAGRARGLDPLALLERNDSYRYFDAAGFFYRTGPTNTNVCDIQILIVR